MTSKAKMSSPISSTTLAKKTVAELRAICKKIGAPCDSKMKKQELFDAIISWKMMSGPGGKPKKIVIKTTVSGIKKGSPKGGAPKNGAPKVACSHSTCPDAFCVLDTGKCVKKTAKGLPYGMEGLKTKYGSDFVFDANLRILGKKADVDQYKLDQRSPSRSPVRSPRRSRSPSRSRSASPARKKSPIKKKSSVKKTKKCTDAADWLECDKGQICSTPSGKCIKDTKVNRYGAKGDKAQLLVDGRVIVGTAKAIQNLHKILGGQIKTGKSPSPSKKKTPPVKKPGKKPTKKSPSPRKSPTKVGGGYSLLITIRDDYGKNEPTHVLHASTLKDLSKAFQTYVNKKRKMEDYMDDEEFEEVVKNVVKDIQNGKDTAPELNSAYLLSIKKSGSSSSPSPSKRRSSSRSPSKRRSSSPAKKKTPPKKSTKKTKKCTDKEDWLECDKGQICSAPSGKCIKDTKVNRHGAKNDKYQLLVDGRTIVGTEKTIKNLHKILGGQIKTGKSVSPPKKKSASPGRSASPVKRKSTSPRKSSSPRRSSTSPRKSTPPKKKSPAKKTKKCTDVTDWLECDKGQICSAPSGKCVKDTKINRHGSKNDKVELSVDGRTIVGTAKTIQSLQKILGGKISGGKKSASPVRSASPVKRKSPRKPTPPKKKSPRKSPSPAKRRSSSPRRTPPRKPTPPKKKSPTKKKSPSRKSPQTLAAIENRLNELLEEGGNENEIKMLKDKLSKIKTSGTTQMPAKVTMKQQELYKTFAGCLASLEAN